MADNWTNTTFLDYSDFGMSTSMDGIDGGDSTSGPTMNPPPGVVHQQQQQVHGGQHCTTTLGGGEYSSSGTNTVPLSYADQWTNTVCNSWDGSTPVPPPLSSVVPPPPSIVHRHTNTSSSTGVAMVCFGVNTTTPFTVDGPTTTTLSGHNSGSGAEQSGGRGNSNNILHDLDPATAAQLALADFADIETQTDEYPWSDLEAFLTSDGDGGLGGGGGGGPSGSASSGAAFVEHLLNSTETQTTESNLWGNCNSYTTTTTTSDYINSGIDPSNATAGLSSTDVTNKMMEDFNG